MSARHSRRRRVSVATMLLVVLAGALAGATWVTVGRLFTPEPAAHAAPTATIPPTTRDWQRVELVQVLSVEAGNQITVQAPDSKVEVVRIAGLDSPAGAECGTTEARDATRDAIGRQEVTLVADAKGRTRDDDGRRVAYVVLPTQMSWTDGAIAGGTGRTDTSRIWQYAAGQLDEENTAKARNRGLWSSCWKEER